MNLGDFLHSKRWKLIQNYIYSWGASVVLIGALAKLEHYPIASVLLGVGMSIEAIIFFISAFEPMMELPDWKKVYPQLRTDDIKDKEVEQLNELDNKYSNFFGSGSGSGGGGGEVSIKDIPKEQIDKLNQSFKRIAEVAAGIQEISGATNATSKFVKNLNEASTSIGAVVEANEKVSVEMDKSVKEIATSYRSAAENLKSSSNKASSGIEQTINNLSASYKETAESIKAASQKATSGIDSAVTDLTTNVKGTSENISKSYHDMSTSISGGMKNFEKGSEDFVGKIEQLNKNMAALNTAYELHLKGANKVEQVVDQYSKGVTEIGTLLNTSIEETRKFNASTKEFNDNIQALNKVYGNMLGALNVKK